MATAIDKALFDPALLGAALGDASSWTTWRCVLKAAFGLDLNRDEARAFAAVAGSRAPPRKRVRELWAIVGRRGGKSRMAAAIAVYLACFVKHKLAVTGRSSTNTLCAWLRGHRFEAAGLTLLTRPAGLLDQVKNPAAPAMRREADQDWANAGSPLPATMDRRGEQQRLLHREGRDRAGARPSHQVGDQWVA
ncbi:MAG: hypothetical protein ACLP0B_03935, partial [Steroidobacteraceae bacterium]